MKSFCPDFNSVNLYKDSLYNIYLKNFKGISLIGRATVLHTEG